MISDACRQKTIVFLQQAENRKNIDTGSMAWNWFMFPYLWRFCRRSAIFFLALLSFAMTIGYACMEGYPGGVEKPMGLKVFTALVAVAKMLVHTYIYRLEGNPEPHPSRLYAIGLGAFSACAKIGECTLICHLVDKNIPSGGATLYCMVAQGIAEGLMSIITAAAYGPSDAVAFGGPGQPFYYMGHHGFCPGLSIAEKKALIESVIAGKLLSPE